MGLLSLSALHLVGSTLGSSVFSGAAGSFVLTASLVLVFLSTCYKFTSHRYLTMRPRGTEFGGSTSSTWADF